DLDDMKANRQTRQGWVVVFGHDDIAPRKAGARRPGVAARQGAVMGGGGVIVDHGAAALVESPQTSRPGLIPTQDLTEIQDNIFGLASYVPDPEIGDRTNKAAVISPENVDGRQVSRGVNRARAGQAGSYSGAIQVEGGGA